MMARALSASLVFALPSLTTSYSLATGCACQCRSAAAPRAAALHMQMIPGQDKVIDSQDTYNVMMRTLLETNASIADQISKNYHLVDYAFLKKLETAKVPVKTTRPAGQATARARPAHEGPSEEAATAEGWAANPPCLPAEAAKAETTAEAPRRH